MKKGSSLNRLAFSATGHCLTGCAIGEVLGLVIASALGWGNVASIALAIVLAFFFGYSLTMLPLLRSGITLAVAFATAFPVNRYLIARGKGHAVVHKYHGGHDHHEGGDEL